VRRAASNDMGHMFETPSHRRAMKVELDGCRASVAVQFSGAELLCIVQRQNLVRTD